MRRGQYRHYVEIDANQYYLDTDAGLVSSPAVAFAYAYANIRTASAAEIERFRQMKMEVTHMVELSDYLAGVTGKMRVIHNARTFQIKQVLHDEHRQRWTQLVCKETT